MSPRGSLKQSVRTLYAAGASSACRRSGRRAGSRRILRKPRGAGHLQRRARVAAGAATLSRVVSTAGRTALQGTRLVVRHGGEL
eukprot:6180736-Pleurochrysis_carterae.AAC.1